MEKIMEFVNLAIETYGVEGTLYRGLAIAALAAILVAGVIHFLSPDDTIG